ncbi:ABC transporter permease [Candidatus Bipolaricaulota bacterium]
MRKFFDFLQLAGQSIMHRRMRSWLTVIGVFIGITAVVALLSLGFGLERTVTDQVSGMFGYDTFLVAGGDMFGGGPHGGEAEEYALDIALLRSIEGIKTAAALRERTGFIQAPTDENGVTPPGAFMPVIGLSSELLTDFESFTGELSALPGGRLFDPGESNVMMLDQEIANRLGVDVGDTVFVAGDGEGLDLEVVGIMEPSEEETDDESGGGFGAAFEFGSEGDTIYVPYGTMDLLWDEEADVLITLVRSEEGYDVDEVADRAEEALNDRGSEISAITSSDISGFIEEFMRTISAFLAGIAGISLLVGGVGVMNTMFTSVLERTKEIGVMKAVGAKNSHVWTIFLIESGLMGLVGGIVGTILGLGLDVLASQLLERVFDFPLVIVVNPGLIVWTLVGSFGLGALAGIWPAWRASRLQVVDALRYE